MKDLQKAEDLYFSLILKGINFQNIPNDKELMVVLYTIWDALYLKFSNRANALYQNREEKE